MYNTVQYNISVGLLLLNTKQINKINNHTYIITRSKYDIEYDDDDTGVSVGTSDHAGSYDQLFYYVTCIGSWFYLASKLGHAAVTSVYL